MKRSAFLIPALVLPLLLGACGTGDSVPTSSQDTVPPSVTLQALPERLTEAQTLNVEAAASDNVAVKEVRFLVNGQLLTIDREAPYQANVALQQNGTYVIKAVAVDTSGQESAATRTVKLELADTEKPTLDLTGPNTVSAGMEAEFLVTAADNVGVTRVEFYEGATRLFTDTQAPFTLRRTFTAAQAGSHTLRAVAYDAAGNQNEALISFRVTADPAQVADTVKPTVTLRVPTSPVTTAGLYELGVSASDNVGVTRLEVQLIRDSVVLPVPALPVNGGTVTLPLTRQWNGTYRLVAVAYDAAGNSSRQEATLEVRIP